jgi:biofilm PGA synthesis N-glycosyltransferase PgaC
MDMDMDMEFITTHFNNLITTLGDKGFYIDAWEQLLADMSRFLVYLGSSDFWGAVTGFIFEFSFFYPLVMAYLWMLGALIYYFHWERGTGGGETEVPALKEYPPVSILIPCHNESDCIEDTITYLEKLDYPHYEIIAINDASTDDTLEILLRLAEKYPHLRVVNLEDNQGKATGLYVASLASKHEFLICIDADALLSPSAVTWMMSHFISGPRVGAVTGNPRIRTRSTLLGRIQVCEFSAIIGLIKRAQRVYGRIFTVSGVIVGFRKTALHRVGYWSNDMITEDIDISWKLQLDHWQIRYEPHALCWILMPETLSGLFQQRLRWAQGGAEVMMKYMGQLTTWLSRRMWPVYIEYFVSILWSYSILFTFILWLLGHFMEMPKHLIVPTLLPGWNGVLLGVTCLMQFGVSLLIDSHYEKNIFKYYFWVIWYPIIYWTLNALVTCIGLPKALLRKKGKRAVWVSPDRGVKKSE